MTANSSTPTVMQPAPPPPLPGTLPLSRQTGAIGLPMAAAFLAVAATTVAVQMARQTQRPLEQQRTTEARMDRIQAALRAFAMSQGRLPCPADGAASTGVASPVTAIDVCPNPNGMVPWATLGLQADDALDAWARQISYRVYDGLPGMTQANGADMSDCDTVEPAPASASPPRYLCTTAHDVVPGDFLSPGNRPGLTVRVNGANQPQIAWVLVSHGPSGRGAWLPRSGGQRMALPVNGGDENSNTQPAPAAFVQRTEQVLAASGTPLDAASDVNHFDDVVRFQSIQDLIAKAGRGSRDWPEGGGPGPVVAANAPSVVLDGSALAAAGVNPSGFQTGSPSFTVPASGSSPGLVVSTPNGQIAFDNTGNPKQGFGVCPASGACNASGAQLSSGETLSFKLVNATAYKFGAILDNFAAMKVVSFTFKLAGVQIGAVVNKTSVGLAAVSNVSSSTGAAFDEVVVAPVGGAAFLIDSARFCDATTNCVP